MPTCSLSHAQSQMHSLRVYQGQIHSLQGQLQRADHPTSVQLQQQHLELNSELRVLRTLFEGAQITSAANKEPVANTFLSQKQLHPQQSPISESQHQPEQPNHWDIPNVGPANVPLQLLAEHAARPVHASCCCCCWLRSVVSCRLK